MDVEGESGSSPKLNKEPLPASCFEISESAASVSSEPSKLNRGAHVAIAWRQARARTTAVDHDLRLGAMIWSSLRIAASDRAVAGTAVAETKLKVSRRVLFLYTQLDSCLRV